MKKSMRIDLKKIKERTSRTSLTLTFSIFIFCILLSANLLTAVISWLLTEFHVISEIEGEFPIGSLILFMSLNSLIIGSVIVFFSSRFPLKPVNELINKMDRLASGDFKTRLQFGSITSAHPTAKELSASFNTMARELENTEILRNDFINSFSHEFKTPIVSITGLAHLIESGNLTEEQRMEYARAIREESMRLATMASNVLILTKVENQTILTGVSRFNLSEQIRSAVLLLEEKWMSKNIELQIDFDEHTIEANEEMLMQVWLNLVDNAIKFAPDRGTVGLEIGDAGDNFLVRVSNTGKEIPLDKQGKVFVKFYQTDESHATMGNGIGLAIVKRIVELHGGTVGVESRCGKTTFSVTIPKKQT